MKTKLLQGVAAFTVGLFSSATIHPPPCQGSTCPAVTQACGGGKLPSCPDFQAPIAKGTPNG